MLLETLMVKLAGDVSDFVGKMNGAAQAISAVGDKMQATGQRIQAIGQQWSLYVSAPLIAMGKAALDSAADFEVSMNTIEQVTDATTEQMKAMSDQALKLGKATVFSAGEAAQAQLELAKAGMDVQETMDAMPGVLDLAAAGGVELAYAAKLTAGALNAFSLDAKESTRVANLLAAAANASAADIQDLSLGFAQGGFAFAAANQQVDDLAAALAILTNVGLKGTDAGTALKNMFQQLYGPTDIAKKTMKSYGLAVFDAQGNMKPLAEIIALFNEKLGGMSQKQRLAILDTILLSDGMKAMIPLMTAGKDGFLAMKGAVNEQGAASDVANARMKGLSGAIEYFKGTLDSLMIETALPWLEQLSAIIRSTADWIAKFGELDPAVQKTIVIVAALAAALGPVLIYSGLLVQAAGALVSAFGVMLVPLGLMAAGFTALSLALGINIQDWSALGRYMTETLTTGDYMNQWLDELPAPLQAAALNVGMVGASFGELTKYIGETLTTGNAHNQWLLQLPAPLQAAALSTGTFIVSIQDLGRYMAETLITGDHLNEWLDKLPKPIQPVVEALGSMLSKVRDVGLGFAEEMPAMIQEVKDLSSTVGREIPLIVGHFADLWNALTGGANGRAVGQFLGKFVTTAIKGVGTILTQIRAVMDAFDILARATGAILAGDWAGYWALKDEWNKAWATFGAATADQWKQFSSMFDAAEVPQPTGPYLGTQGFASGGWVGRSGRYLVGEEGAELVDLPAGAYVHNARNTERMGGITINLPLTVPAGANAHQVTLAARDGILQGLRQVGLA